MVRVWRTLEIGREGVGDALNELHNVFAKAVPLALTKSMNLLAEGIIKETQWQVREAKFALERVLRDFDRARVELAKGLNGLGLDRVVEHGSTAEHESQIQKEDGRTYA